MRLNWAQVLIAAKAIADYVREQVKEQEGMKIGIMAIGRGGAIVAGMVSNQLPREMSGHLPIYVMDQRDLEVGRIKGTTWNRYDVNSLVIIDDIADTGETLKKVLSKLFSKYKKIRIAALVKIIAAQ